jgi:hypothetical protein
LRSDKYQLPAARLLENYESESSVEANKDTDPEVGDDAGTRLEASSVVKPKGKTRAAAAKQSASTVAMKVVAAKLTKLEVENNRKRKMSPPPVVETLVIPTPTSREVESDEEEDEATDDPQVFEEHTVRRSLSPTANRQRELE